MSDKILAFYDISGIQNYIFHTEKVKENISSSFYVQDLMDNIMIDTIEEYKIDKIEKYKNDISNENKLEVITKYSYYDNDKSEVLVNNFDGNKNIEIIYIGGGNSLVLYKDLKVYKEINKIISKKLLESTGGALGLVVDHIETNVNNYYQDMINLKCKMSIKKDAFIPTKFQQGVAINYECQDGFYTNENNKSERQSEFMLCRTKGLKKRRDKLLNELKGDDELINYTPEFNKLWQKEGDNFIGVVHIDGNNMGQYMSTLINKDSIDYTETVKKVRLVTEKIKILYRKTFTELAKYIFNKKENLLKSDKLKPSDKNIPLIPIILNGDDVTFVCNGRLAIQTAVKYLDILKENTIKIFGKESGLSACAGIAIVKSHYPFKYSYDLAEQLCASAKKKAKALNKEKPGNWFDYHIVYDGFDKELNVVREHNYNVVGMKTVKNKNFNFPCYNLLLRPLTIDTYDWPQYIFKNILKLKNDLNVIPRNGKKKLMKNFRKSEIDVNCYNDKLKSRGFILPEFSLYRDSIPSNKLFDPNQTPYYEALELEDFYVEEFEEENYEV